MRIKTLLFVLGILTCQLFYSDAQAQWGGGGFRTPRYSYHGLDPIATARKKPFQRYGVGLTYVPVSGAFSTTTFNEFGDVDSIESVNIKGWGAGVNYSLIIPCARTGEKTLMAVYIGLNVNFYLFDVPQISIPTGYGGAVNYSGAGSAFMFGLPVGLDLITGGEATLDRSNRFSFVVGGGMYPLASIGGVYESVGAALRVPLYAKAEVGFHFGINWKLRATYLSKSPISYEKGSEYVFDGTYNASLKANDRFMLSLLVQPFSFGWD